MNEEALFARRSKATAAALAVDLLAEHFNDAQGKLDREMFLRIDKGVAISPDEALQFIYMKHAHHKLFAKLKTTMEAGQTANARLAPLFNGATNA